MTSAIKMTEAEWLACRASTQMLEAGGESLSERKLRLHACHTFWRWRSAEIRFQNVVAFSFAIDVAARMADREATPDDVDLAGQQLSQWMDRWNGGETSMRGWEVCFHAISQPIRLEGAVSLLVGWRWLQQFRSAEDTGTQTESDAQVALLTELLGNPFRPVAFSPEWRSDTVLSLARHLYESRDFSAMPILADALQDAGCTNDNILSHCRDETLTHVRGCWVVDLVLGKS